jgi:predicted 3-demethylubiquinone-9 3-methyltransferase (glyoxalase superfamily)
MAGTLNRITPFLWFDDQAEAETAKGQRNWLSLLPRRL